MSADNWTICPQCKVEAKAEYEATQDFADRSYGVVPAEEYEQLRDDADQPFGIDETLRENYEFYLSEEGEFSASFRAVCQECDFSFQFKYEEQVELRELVD